MTDRGNVKIMTVMGDALMDGLSDAGSIPARSIKKCRIRGIFYFGNSLETFAAGSITLGNRVGF